jgi:hypothetical protein
MKQLIVVAVFVLFSANAWAAIEYKGITSADLESLHSEVWAMEGATSRLEEGYERITVPSKYTTYYFTTTEYPCHPAVVIQEITEKDGAIWIEAKGLTAGDREKFEKWLKGFERQHEIIKRRMSGK